MWKELDDEELCVPRKESEGKQRHPEAVSKTRIVLHIQGKRVDLPSASSFHEFGISY